MLSASLGVSLLPDDGPERRRRATGWGALGTLAITHDVSRFTLATVLQPGTKTRVLARFSTVGAIDAERDVRGFALKFYSKDGIWDLVGNNTPVCFVRDPNKLRDFICAQGRNPRVELRSPTAMWGFWSLTPESLHQVTMLMSDRGIPTSPMYMNGYGAHTYSLFSRSGERWWAKLHFKTRQGHRFYTDQQAEYVIGGSRESYQASMFHAIKRGDFPRWMLQIQVMSESDVERARFDPFDVTKVWPHADHPLIDVGVMLLDRNPDNYFTQIESATFAASNVVPGISRSPDNMRVSGDRHRPMADNFEQVTELFLHVLGPDERLRLFANIASSMAGVPAPIKERQCRLFDRVHRDYGRGVRMALDEAG